MTSDPNKKTTRTFQCREALWQKFEQMARELECSVDYLINDSMKQYARQRGYGAAGAGGQSLPPPLVAPAPPLPSGHPAATTPVPAAPPPLLAPLPPPVAPAPPLPPPPGASRGAAPPGPLPPVGRPQKRAGVAPPVAAPPPPAGGATRKPPPPLAPSRSIPPPPGGSKAPPLPAPPAVSAPSQPSGSLTITYQGEVFQVTKDRFIIGRGKQTSDLTIKDPNVSRQHAMIEFLTGQYYIVDMGSTNGVEYNGQRVQRKVISDGDTFKVCDHELRFSFQ
jgi:hypothetical protein